jgi:hypothetical protein
LTIPSFGQNKYISDTVRVSTSTILLRRGDNTFYQYYRSFEKRFKMSDGTCYYVVLFDSVNSKEADKIKLNYFINKFLNQQRIDQPTEIVIQNIPDELIFTDLTRKDPDNPNLPLVKMAGHLNVFILTKDLGYKNHLETARFKGYPNNIHTVRTYENADLPSVSIVEKINYGGSCIPFEDSLTIKFVAGNILRTEPMYLYKLKQYEDSIVQLNKMISEGKNLVTPDASVTKNAPPNQNRQTGNASQTKPNPAEKQDSPKTTIQSQPSSEKIIVEPNGHSSSSNNTPLPLQKVSMNFKICDSTIFRIEPPNRGGDTVFNVYPVKGGVDSSLYYGFFVNKQEGVRYKIECVKGEVKDSYELQKLNLPEFCKLNDNYEFYCISEKVRDFSARYIGTSTISEVVVTAYRGDKSQKSKKIKVKFKS